MGKAMNYVFIKEFGLQKIVESVLGYYFAEVRLHLKSFCSNYKSLITMSVTSPSCLESRSIVEASCKLQHVEAVITISKVSIIK
jgi:hypothetical protein